MPLEPGPDLDLRVAKAINLNVGKFRVTQGMVWVDSPGFSYRFEPSRDIRQAFQVADEVGLFNDWQLGRDVDQWRIATFDHDWGETLATGETIPLAICTAILRKKGATA